MIVVGLMSGTSADGTDAAVVQIKGAPPDLRWKLLHFHTSPHPEWLRRAVLEAADGRTGTVDKVCEVNVRLGEQFAVVALAAIEAAGLRPEQVQLIGSHGQTLWHAPDLGATLQVGEPAVIAERTGITVIGNFRARDMAAGGQGAPLVPFVDVLLLSDPNRARAAQNIGGIGNVTYLPATDNAVGEPFAFDTGPGNVLIDLAAAWATNGEASYDKDGAMAAQGKVDEELLAWLLQDAYLEKEPPKTTGRELYSAAYFQEIVGRGGKLGVAAEDLVATVTAFTARSIARAYRQFLPTMPAEVIVSGGGASNPTLMRMLGEGLAPAKVMTSDGFGLPSDAKEAIAFAILAYETWHGRPSNLPAATGAERAVVLGSFTPGRGR